MLLLAACTGSLSPTGGWAAPVVTGDGILAAERDGSLVLIDAQAGGFTPGFATVFPGNSLDIGKIYGTPLVTEDAIYLAAYDCRGSDCEANVVALNRIDGTPLWGEFKQFTPPGQDDGDRDSVLNWLNVETEIVGNVALHEDTLLAGTSFVGNEDQPGGYLIAVDATPGAVTGRVKWMVPFEERIWSSPKVSDGVAYVTVMDSRVYAIDLSDGVSELVDSAQARVLWSFEADGAMTASPVIEDGKLYVGDFEGSFYALDLEARAADQTGRTLDRSREWKFDAGAWIWAGGVIDGDVIYASTLGGKVFALDKGSGRELWANPAEIDGQIVGNPVVYLGPQQPVSGTRGKLLAVPSGSRDVWVVDAATGEDLGKFNTGAGVKSSPAATDSLLYVHTLNRELQWFSLADRAQLGCVKLQSGDRCG